VIENLWTQGNQEIEAWKGAPTPDLISHIIQRYHLEARVGMARMENLAEEAVLLEGPDHPGLVPVRDEILRFCTAFRAHMTLEEHSLFPALLDPSRSQAAGVGSQLMPPLVKLLEDEHQAETGLFVRLRTLSAAALPSAGARNLQARLQHTFKALEKSLQSHIFLETQVLFRRVF
jgi:regulator of cell morphogenesis and NO signaling